MTIQWTVFDSTTGEILRTGETSTMAQALVQGNTPGTKVITTGSDPVVQKVDVTTVPASPSLVTRPTPGVAVSKTSFLADGSDSVTISGIANPSTYHIDVPVELGIAVISDATITDGSLVITTTVTGAYVVTIKNFPKADYTVTLNAA